MEYNVPAEKQGQIHLKVTHLDNNLPEKKVKVTRVENNISEEQSQGHLKVNLERYNVQSGRKLQAYGSSLSIEPLSFWNLLFVFSSGPCQ